MTTIADIQTKLLNAFESRIKGQVNKPSIKGKLPAGNFTFDAFKQALKLVGDPLTSIEAEFLYVFWDTQAGTQDQNGSVSADLAAKDLLSSVESYSGGGLPSGEDRKGAASGNKSNRSSVPDGPFGGGAYAADARSNRGGGSDPAYAGGATPSFKPATDNSRPRGNQSSVPGGILAHDENAPTQPPSSRGGGNKSNQSSVAGGIFAEAAPAQKYRQPTRSNQSSIEGGPIG